MTSQVNIDNISAIENEFGWRTWSSTTALKHAYGEYLLQQNWNVAIDVNIDDNVQADVIARRQDQVVVVAVYKDIDSSNVHDVINKIACYRQCYPKADIYALVERIYLDDYFDEFVFSAEETKRSDDSSTEESSETCVMLLKQYNIERVAYGPDDYCDVPGGVNVPEDIKFKRVELISWLALLVVLVILMFFLFVSLSN